MTCPYKYIKENDIILTRYDFGHIRGSCMNIGGNKYIGISDSLSFVQERETIAHEIGHFIDGTESMVHIRSAEWNAEKIGREILIPYDSLIEAIEEDEGVCDASSLAQRFGVSIEYMMNRVRDVFHNS